MLHVVNISSLLFVPVTVINLRREHLGPGRGTLATFFYTVLFLKLWSYVQVNHWCRGHHSTCRKPVRYQSVNDFQINRDNLRCE